MCEKGLCDPYPNRVSKFPLLSIIMSTELLLSDIISTVTFCLTC